MHRCSLFIERAFKNLQIWCSRQFKRETTFEKTRPARSFSLSDWRWGEGLEVGNARGAGTWGWSRGEDMRTR